MINWKSGTTNIGRVQYWLSGSSSPYISYGSIFTQAYDTASRSIMRLWAYFGSSVVAGITLTAWSVSDTRAEIQAAQTTLSGNLAVDGNLGTWTSQTLATGWSTFGSPYGAMRRRKFGDIVYLTGMVTTGAGLWTTTPLIATLPSGFRPSVRLIFMLTGSNSQAVRVDVETDGSVRYMAGGAGSAWISLDGISFSTN